MEDLVSYRAPNPPRRPYPPRYFPESDRIRDARASRCTTASLFTAEPPQARKRGLGLVAEHGHHAALGGVVEVVAVGHPLAGAGGVEVAEDLLTGSDDDRVLARPGRAELEGVPVDVHRVVHRGGVGEDHPDPLTLGHEELQRARAGHVEGLAVDAPVVAGHS